LGEQAQAVLDLKTACPILFHPDYTVGSGIAPDLLTFCN
jgi:hypothetical protein